jgi:hypothetical protein
MPEPSGFVSAANILRLQQFLCNTPEEKERLSNAIDLWDSVPRYSVNRKAANRAVRMENFPETHITTFHHRGRAYGCTISPANVKDIWQVTSYPQDDCYKSAGGSIKPGSSSWRDCLISSSSWHLTQSSFYNQQLNKLLSLT